MREGSVVVAAVLLTGAVAYWSTHGGGGNWREAEPREEAPVAAVAPPRGSAMPEPVAPATGSPDIPDTLDAVGKAAVCAELLEVIRGAEAALRDPRSRAAVEQLTAQRQAYQAKRVALGC